MEINHRTLPADALYMNTFISQTTEEHKQVKRKTQLNTTIYSVQP